MEVEMEARVKPVPYKIRAMSRESPTQKASHVLDPDLRTHWSTATNTKEWILLELEETCLLSHIRIHNKSVLEWEIAVGLRYKPETFVKVRPRCEAPRRDMLYPMNYTPCRFVRISCLRGNPIAIFFVQLIGISVPGLEQEFQPVIDYLLPHIISHKHDAHDIHLQLLHDLTSRLSPFVSHLETDLTTFPENMETNIRFLSMLVGPFYPILAVVSERESSKAASGMLEADQNRSSQSSLLTISSNFQVQSRKVRGLNYSQHTPTSLLVFRPDAVLLLLRKAFKDSHLGNLCKTVSRLLKRLSAPGCSELFSANVETATTNGTEDYLLKAEPVFQTQLTDYSQLFGEEFKVVEEETSDIPTANVIDIAAVEEALLHILFACASQPAICRRLSDPKSDLLSAVPFIQAMLPALRPEGVNSSNCEQVDEAFLQWQAPLVQNALTQIAAISSSTTYRPLLDALSSYLSSYSPSQAKAACVLIDLCSGPLAPWIHMVIAKVDLTIELLEDFLGILQNPQYGNNHVRAALFCIILALSGHMDNVLPKFKEVKHRLLFVIEMLEPFLMPAITTIKNTIAFGEVSAVFLERQERACAQALEFVRTAVQKPAVLPSLENEWRKGHVTPSVLLSILAPHVPLPPGIDFQKTAKIKHPEHEPSSTLSVSSEQQSAPLSKSNAIYEDGDGKPEVMDGISKNGISEDGSQLFAPADMKNMSLRSFSAPFERNPPDLLPLGQKTLKSGANASTDSTHMKKMKEDAALSDESLDLQTEYLQLVNFQARELKASEFIHFAEELHARADFDIESHDASVDALMLAAECHLNPYFMGDSCLENESKKFASKSSEVLNANSMSDVLFPREKMPAVNVISNLEDKRDRNVINILLQAAEWQSGILSVTQYDKQNDEKSLVCDIDDHENEFKLFSTDPDSMDAVTLLRQHQRILCNFLMRQLQREQHNMYEVLLHGLLFYLRSATKIYSSPESIVDIILQAAERLNKVLLSLYYQRKDMSSSIENDKLFGIRRQWKLLQRVIYSAAGNEIDDETHDYWKRGYHYRNLVPVSSWVSMIPFISFSSYPLVRYVGWMALATFARDHQDRGVLMVQDINLMAGLLTVFKDELASVKNLRFKESRENQTHFQSDQSSSKNGNAVHKNDSEGDLEYGGFVNALHPELEMFFPNIRNQFNKNAEVILDIVCFHLKSIPPSYIPDVLVWFSEFCANPYTFRDRNKKSNTDSHDDLRGHVASNLKFIILRILEVIILEHMDIIVPEIPKLIQLLHSLCKSSYCDVALLESVLTILKPLITYTVSKLTTSDCILHEDSSAMSFEHLCFNSLISELKSGPANNDISGEHDSQGALLIYLTGCLLTDISIAQRKEVLQSLLQWTSFSCFDSTVAYYDYLCAFQKVFDALNFLVQDSLEDLGVFSKNEFSSVIRESASFGNCGNCSALQLGSEKGEQDTLEWEINSQEDSCIQEDSLLNMRDSIRSENGNFNYENKDVENSRLKNFFSVADIEEFMKVLKSIVFGLSQTLELCLKFHPQMTSELSKAITYCLLYAGALVPAYRLFRTNDKDSNNETSLYITDAEKTSSIWSVSLETVSDSSLAFAKSHCWQVSAAMIECLLQLPLSFNLNSITRSLFSFFEYFCFNAPKISFRLQVSKWLSKSFERETKFFSNSEFMPLIEFFCKMLDHPEPEQRFTAMQQLGKIVELEELGKLKGCVMRKSGEEDNVEATVKNLSQSGLVCTLVSHTWDRVASLATSELSTNMRNEALKLLYNFVPYSERHHMQSVFHSIDSLLPAVVSFTVLEGQFTCLVLSLLARACLYSDFEDIDILPQSLWDNVELLAISKKGHILLQLESSLCKALLQFKDQTDNAKEELEEALTNHPDDKCSDASLADVRESILQVLARMKSLRSKFDEVEKSCNQEVKELEELEIELELMQEEERIQGFSSSGNKPPKVKSVSSKTPTINVHKRLEEIREDIRKHEISEVRKEITARRERDRMARHTRQRNLQEAALHELELIQELDRERIADAEREIERQRSLERERAKTREMRYNLEMEVEKRNQREIQRELEQREAGLRPSRREFATTSSSRPRERYRERDGRPCQDGVLRPSSSGGVIREGSGTPPPTPNATASASSVINIGPLSSTPTIITNSSRAFLGQPSTLLQNRERFDDRSYEDAFDPMRDNGDTGSVGDPELGSTIDMMNMGGYVASNRQISRSGKPRQIIERRERETRREGKWERKQG